MDRYICLEPQTLTPEFNMVHSPLHSSGFYNTPVFSQRYEKAKLSMLIFPLRKIEHFLAMTEDTNKE